MGKLKGVDWVLMVSMNSKSREISWARATWERMNSMIRKVFTISPDYEG
jgi:hypothetical protein